MENRIFVVFFPFYILLSLQFNYLCFRIHIFPSYSYWFVGSFSTGYTQRLSISFSFFFFCLYSSASLTSLYLSQLSPHRLSTSRLIQLSFFPSQPSPALSTFVSRSLLFILSYCSSPRSSALCSSTLISSCLCL